MIERRARTVARSRLLLWIACQVAVAPAALFAGTDAVLTVERHSEWWDSGGGLVLSGDETGTLYLGDGRARYDQGPDHSWILLEREKKLLLLDHRNATYQQFDVPVRLEDLLPAPDREKLPGLVRVSVPDVVKTPSEELREVSGWPARKVVLAGKPPEGSTYYDFEVWVAPDLPVDHRLHGELLRSFGALHLGFRGIAEEIARLDGFPVLRRSVVTRPNGGKDVDVRTLSGLSRREVPETIYRPPAAYRLVPIDPAAWVHFD